MSESNTTVSVNTRDRMFCRYHKGMKISHYCQEDDENLCEKCLERHSKHTVENMKEKCTQACKPWQDIKNQLTRVKNLITEHKEKFNEADYNKFIERASAFHTRYTRITDYKNLLMLKQILDYKDKASKYKDKALDFGKKLIKAELGTDYLSNKARKLKEEGKNEGSSEVFQLPDTPAPKKKKALSQPAFQSNESSEVITTSSAKQDSKTTKESKTPKTKAKTNPEVPKETIIDISGGSKKPKTPTAAKKNKEQGLPSQILAEPTRVGVQPLPSIKDLQTIIKAMQHSFSDLEQDYTIEKSKANYRLDTLDQVFVETNKRLLNIGEENHTLKQDLAACQSKLKSCRKAITMLQDELIKQRSRIEKLQIESRGNGRKRDIKAKSKESDSSDSSSSSESEVEMQTPVKNGKKSSKDSKKRKASSSKSSSSSSDLSSESD